jgi:hypothetical protein
MAVSNAKRNAQRQRSLGSRSSKDGVIGLNLR